MYSQAFEMSQEFKILDDEYDMNYWELEKVVHIIRYLYNYDLVH